MSQSDWPEPKFVPMGETGQALNPARIDHAYEYIQTNMTYGEIIQLVARLIPELSVEMILTILHKAWGKDGS